MKRMYIICKNHLDLTWRRCFEQYFAYDGFVIRPYAEIEEHLLDWWINAVEQSDMVYEIEQTATVRKYIERNPSQQERVKRLIDAGKLKIVGGGESVIDYNMTDGESIVRNHFYSRRYLEENFGITPRFAACPDTFGLSTQLPQLFRQLGYPAISTFARVFGGHAPVWEGISGDRVAIATNEYAQMGDSDFVKYYACGVCKGEGCPSCKGTGIDIEYRHFCRDGTWEAFLSGIMHHSRNGNDELVVAFASEEVIEPDDFYEKMSHAAKLGGYEAVYLGSEDYIADHFADIIARVEHNEIESSEIDGRREGNPVAGGCYTSRIRIKQENRIMEALFASAERMATLAANYGFEYPHKTLERLWNKLSFYQFHDALPASHSDYAYQELLDIAREMKTALYRIINAAGACIVKNIPCDAHDSFAVFNPLPWEVKNMPVTGIVRQNRYDETVYQNGFVMDSKGTALPIIELRRGENLNDLSYLVKFCANLPPLGYEVFRFMPDSAQPDEKILDRRIENQRYRITFSRFGIEEIYDKKLDRRILCDGVCSPYLEEDSGHLWGRIGFLRGYGERADKPFCVDVMTHSQKHSISVVCKQYPFGQQATVKICYDRPEESLDHLDWCTTVTLYNSSDKIHFKVDAAWQARDLRLMARFPLPFSPANGNLTYEIPFGQLERPYLNAFDGHLGHTDDHAALRYVCAYDKENDYTVALCNNGTPAHRMSGNAILVSLMRSPTRLLCGYGIEHAREQDGQRTFEFTVSAWKGSIAKGNPAREGMELNAQFPVFTLREHNNALLEKSASLLSLPDSKCMLSALKISQDDKNAVIYRYYEAYGEERIIDFGRKITEVDILEQKNLAEYADGKVHFKPFEIKTLKVNKT